MSLNLRLWRPIQIKKWHQEIFKNDKPIVLELGCGKGEYSVGLAKLYRINFVGIDIKEIESTLEPKNARKRNKQCDVFTNAH